MGAGRHASASRLRYKRGLPHDYTRLFQAVLRERVDPAAYGRAEKQARVASQRLAREAQKETTGAAKRDAKDRGPTPFD
jgi:hypothetical protein